MVGFGSGSVQFDRIWIRPKGFERIRIRNTAYSPIKSMLSSVSREESGPSCSKKRAAVGCQEEPAKRACYSTGWVRKGEISVADPERFDTDPDPTFQADTDPEPEPDPDPAPDPKFV